MEEYPFPTSNAHRLRVVQQLLWDVISLHLYPAERDEIRRALGNSLLDENETLFAEAGALADILGDVQLNTTALLARHQLCSNPQRSMVETEIRLLIDRLHHAAAVSPFGSTVVKERDPDSLLPRQGKRDKAVLEYMTTVAQIAETGGRPPSSGLPPRPPSTAVSSSSRPGTSSRPPTALSASASASISLPSPLSRPGTASPTLPCSRPSTASSAASSVATRYTDAPSVVAGVADKLNVSSIDAVRETLHTALLDERSTLLEDIEYLQGLLEAEADLQVRATAPPPSLAELKDYSSRLAAVVANEEARVEHEVRVSAMFAAAEQQQGKPGRLRGMVDVSRRPPSGGYVSPAAVASPPGTATAAMLSPLRHNSTNGGIQTLVVHSEDKEAARQHHRHPQASGSSTHVAMATGDDTGNGSSVHMATPPRSAPLAAVRRPGSGGSGCNTSTAVLLSGLPPPTSLRTAALLPPTRLSPAADGSSVLTSHTKTLSPGAAVDSPGVDSSLSTSSISRPSHSPSPGRLGSAAAVLAQTQIHNATPQPHVMSQPHPPPPCDKSPPLLAPPSPARVTPVSSSSTPPGVLSSPATSGTGASAALTAVVGSMNTVGPRPLLPRFGSVGRSTTAASTTVAVPASTFNSGSTSNTPRSAGRVSSTVIGREAPSGKAVATATHGSAIAARLSAAGAASTESYGTAVQPRALFGKKQSVVERLDEEVDKIKGGVAAILERYNIRHSTPSSAAIGATEAAAAVAAPPPTSS